jgi:hypothetical protein
MSEYLYRNRLRRRCESCGNLLPVWTERDYSEMLLQSRMGNNLQGQFPESDYIRWQSDPYDSDVYNDPTRRWICESCCYEHGMDI